MKKNENVGLTPVNWILSIVGILIFASFIILPPVFRTVFKKEVVEEVPEEKLVVVQMICTRKNYSVGNHTENNEVIFTYAKDSLRTYQKTTKQQYKSITTYEEEKASKSKLSTAYSLVDGVKYNLSKDENNLIITIEEQYDLAIFKDDKVKLPDSEEEIEVKAPYKLGDSATGIISELTNTGYKCEEAK